MLEGHVLEHFRGRHCVRIVNRHSDHSDDDDDEVEKRSKRRTKKHRRKNANQVRSLFMFLSTFSF